MWSFLNTARVSLLSSNKCSGTAINEILPSASLIVYPNPASNGITLEWPGEYNFERLEVLDVVGKVMVTKNISSVYAKYQLNTTNLTNGIYFVRLINGTKATIKKIVISK
jgi:hypothetical protein